MSRQRVKHILSPRSAELPVQTSDSSAVFLRNALGMFSAVDIELYGTAQEPREREKKADWWKSSQKGVPSYRELAARSVRVWRFARIAYEDSHCQDSRFHESFARNSPI